MQGCPPLEQLERYLSGDGAAPELAQHVASCASCRSLSDRVRANNALLAELRPSAAESEPAPASAALGLEFPGYTILGEIHRGGQGIVYRAVQQRTKRVVALKVLIEGSFASPVKRARFEREAELAAQLKHPHIVTLYDRGVTDDGRPFLAMEFVAGNPLSATPAPLPPERNARLRLFVKICRAVAHAHQRGVIHRDLKPGNIVIDDAHEPHILDFGLARAASPLVHADGAPLTMAGEFAGTLAYASPEQLARDAQLVDTRTDVHALGLILYEMLTGRHARRLDLPVAELVRAITGAAPAPPGAGKDLDTIVLKALARDPEARYQSASELAKDVEHHLRGEPIGARRASTLYLLSRALARHKLALAVVLLVAAALLASTVISLAFWRRSQRDAETARAEARRADAVNDFLQDLLFAATPQGARGRTLSLRDVLDESAARLSIELDQAPDIASALRAAIGKSYQSLGLFAQALPQLKAALEMRRRDLGDRHPLVAASLRELGGLWLEYGRLNEADAAFNEAIAILRAQSERKLELARTLTDAAGVPDARGDNDRATALVQEAILLYRGERYDGPRIATSLQRLGDLLAGRDDRAHAEQRYREALQIWEQQEPRERLGLAACLRGLATSLGEQGRHDESLARWRQATELLRKLLGPDALVVWDGEIASALAESSALGEHRAAASYRLLEPRLDALFASDHPLAGGCLNGLGRLALRAERGEEALRCFTAALQKARALNPESDVGIVAILANLGSAASAAGRDAEAEARCREAVSTARSSAAAAVRGELGVALHALAATLKKQGKLVAAEAAARESLDERIAHLGSEHLDVAESQSLLARLLYARAEYDQAEPLFRAALATRQKFLQPPHPLLAQSENYLAELLRERQLLPEAEALQESALEMRRELYGARHVEVAESLTNLAKIRHERKDPKARELFAAALAIARELSDQPSFRVMCMNNLVACLIDDQDLAAAEPLAREALESSRTNLPGDHIMGAFAARNLGRVCELNHALAEAESCFRDSYETFARVRGDRHPETLWLLRHLIQICRKLGRNDEAERYGTLLKAAGAARGS